MAVANAAAIVARGGLDHAIIRFIPHHYSRGEPQEALGIFRFATFSVAALSAIVTTAIFVLAPTVAGMFDESNFPITLRVISFAVPAIALDQVWRYGLRGFQEVRLAASLEHLFMPTLTIVLVLLLFSLRGADSLSAVIGATGAYWLTAALSLTLLRRRFRQIKDEPRYEAKTWMKFALPMSMEGGLASLLPSVNQVMIGVILATRDVGLYVPAARAAGLVALPLIAINSIFAPTTAALLARGERGKLESLYTSLTVLSAASGGLIAIGLWAGGRWVLALFGSDFSSAYVPLLILLIGQLMAASTGPSGILLAMSGRPWLRLGNAVVGIALNVAFNFFLIPLWGIAGAAAATALAVSAMNLLPLMQLRRRTGLWPYKLGLISVSPPLRRGRT